MKQLNLSRVMADVHNSLDRQFLGYRANPLPLVGAVLRYAGHPSSCHMIRTKAARAVEVEACS